MQAVSHIQVQMGRRSLDLPLSNVTRLPSLNVLQHHTRSFFPVPANETPVFFHEGSRIADESRWSSLLSGPARTTLRLSLQTESVPGLAGVSGSSSVELALDDEPEAVTVQVENEHVSRIDYFAVQGQNGNTTLYFEKSDFDRRMAEFAREGSLSDGMRAMFPPLYKDEYAKLFRDAGAGIVLTTEATALLQSWHKRVAISGGVLAGGLAGACIAASAFGAAETFTVGLAAEGVAATVAAEGVAATVAAEAASAALLSEATAGSGGAAAAAGAGVGATAAATAVAAVAVGYLTFRGLQWLLPEVTKEPYTIMMSVPDEDQGMLELGRQMSMVESSFGPSCGICMERPQDAAAVPCGHTACHTCMEQLVRRHGANTPCPHCRKSIRSIQRIYIG
eukprot:TRINITY_DN23895_c0_g1_i1.p1 TRINITY_DN23895_c0_g1~~TRINITY_DN23895_c0_g1_i1.p1  ORF type:complete len:393 (-),score=87.96 TRINITY_DN23895_c0_g1_i1:337-1515(-)